MSEKIPEKAMEARGKLMTFWQNVRDWAFKYIGGLIMDEKDGKMIISIGRCMLIAVLGWMFTFWGHWVGAMSITPEILATAMVAQLPEGAQVNGVDVLAAAGLVVDALPSSAPPLMQTTFLTACGYVFGTKAKNVLSERLNGR